MNFAVADNVLMIYCQNCRNENATESQFCRFCGSPLVSPQNTANQGYDAHAPRPYMWKTDEYQTQTEARHSTASQPGPTDVQSYGAAPVAYASPQMFSGSYRCPNCMSQFLPRKERRISTTGWIVFAVLLVFFFPLFWIGLLIKEDVAVCPSCSAKIK